MLKVVIKQEREIRKNNSGKEHTRFFWMRWSKSCSGNTDFILSTSLPEVFLMESELDSPTCFFFLRTIWHPRWKKRVQTRKQGTTPVQIHHIHSPGICTAYSNHRIFICAFPWMEWSIYQVMHPRCSLFAAHL